MARIWQDPNRVRDQVTRVSEESGKQTLELIQRKLRKLPAATGALASTYQLETIVQSPDEARYKIVSASPYSIPIEAGAWVQGGRGPHISGSGKGRHIVRDTARRDWARRLAKGLRAG